MWGAHPKEHLMNILECLTDTHKHNTINASENHWRITNTCRHSQKHLQHLLTLLEDQKPIVENKADFGETKPCRQRVYGPLPCRNFSCDTSSSFFWNRQNVGHVFNTARQALGLQLSEISSAERSWAEVTTMMSE